MEHDDKVRIAGALGADRWVDVGRPLGGPLDLLGLRSHVEARLRSSGGRPTDPTWTITRQVPFRADTWERLQELAAEIGDAGRKVAPAQLAAMLVEAGLEDIRRV
jgi:hypothetical protein